MNVVVLTGRLVRDPQVRYTQEGTAVARFTLAVDRGKDKSGEKAADFPSVVAFGKTGELIERYVGKGKLIGVQGRLQTGKYDKDGQTIYTTDIIADRVEFLGSKDGESKQESKSEQMSYEGFSATTDDEIPF